MKVFLANNNNQKKRTLKEPHAKDEGIVAPNFEPEEADTEPERRNSK